MASRNESRLSTPLRTLFIIAFAGAEISSLGMLTAGFYPTLPEWLLSYIPFPAGLVLAAISLHHPSLGVLNTSPLHEDINEQYCVHTFSDTHSIGQEISIAQGNVRVQEWFFQAPWNPLLVAHMDPFREDTTRRVPSSAGSLSSNDGDGKSANSSTASDDSESQSV
ncbi:hypothetical protein GLAREA_00778 [Glarea lozoyensis ATCC 20868]|uniref:Uncharacterized protein n=1 Tax=Glarea lozoyensis (strain ATCC 20868 / MF5171) TaxID=1116229 RepID=S3DT59_GLAL2|nr:uncharacterized protein GLAREA_00778 [Glarea lozoyensis ATCC 20868]EPE29618.1 hypothetical protein GLAREA_00778 [Glarea lozoyensis ATCC 20868]